MGRFDQYLDHTNVEIIPVGEIQFTTKVSILNQQGEELFAKGNVQGALTAFTKAIEINPNFVTADNNLGALYWQNGRYKKL